MESNDILASLPNAKSTKDLQVGVNSPFRVVIYGAAGTGKTELLGSFPRPIWIASFDLKDKPLYGQEDIYVTQYVVEKAADCTNVFNRFRKDWREVKKNPLIKTIALDSITSYDTVNLRHFVILSGKEPEAGATLPVYQDQSGYYQMMFTELKNITDKFVVMTAHESFNVDKESGLISIQPLITGNSILEKLPSQFEEIWYLERKGGEKDERVLHYRPYKKAICTSSMLQGEGSVVLPPLGSSPSAFEKIMREVKKGGRS